MEIGTGSGRVAAPRSVLALLFSLSLVSNVFFLGEFNNSNSVTRVALAIVLIEHGSTSIDALSDLTEDRSVFDGHYYCDKAPGLSFLALPVAAAFIAIVNPRHDDRLWHNGNKTEERISVALAVLIGVCAALTAGLLTAISVALLCSIAIELGAGIRGAATISLICGQATPVWFWATGFFGHSAAAALLVIAFHALLRLTDGRSARRGWWALWFGIALSWATLVEFTAVIPGAMMALFTLFHVRPWQARRRYLGAISLGGLPALLLLLAYNAAAFGSPFELGYGHTDTSEAMRTGFFGISTPSLPVLWEITLGDDRGLLWLSPVLALVPVGAAIAAFSTRWRAFGALWALIVVYYFLLNSGYAYWDGGYSTGPRHVTASLPFACLLLVPLWETGGRIARQAMVMLAAVSGVICLIAVAVDITMPNGTNMSTADYLLTHFWAGPFNGGVAYVLHHLDWPGASPVLPFIPLWGVMACALLRAVRGASPDVEGIESRTSPSFGA